MIVDAVIYQATPQERQRFPWQNLENNETTFVATIALTHTVLAFFVHACCVVIRKLTGTVYLHEPKPKKHVFWTFWLRLHNNLSSHVSSFLFDSCFHTSWSTKTGGAVLKLPAGFFFSSLFGSSMEEWNWNPVEIKEFLWQNKAWKHTEILFNRYSDKA